MAINYEGIGNLREDYKNEQRIAAQVGLITDPSLVLKMYLMLTESSIPFSSDTVIEAKEFIKKEIKDKRLDPLTGMGFAILSENMLNVVRYDTKYPIVLRNQLYDYNETFASAKPLDIRDDGSFCIWEFSIAEHERNAWEIYLDSRRSKSDKEQYLRSFIEGPLGIHGQPIKTAIPLAVYD